MIETQIARKIKRLITNNGGKYMCDPLQKVCHVEGILQNFTVKCCGVKMHESDFGGERSTYIV